ncbi:MAG TPA: PfkB family carbohydrate kinase [Candidatus Bathyarchaeia archaeon]|nr:PfkB family carbohydrate kinase [Candidatus Bathyarchaeia archaeon]
MSVTVVGSIALDTIETPWGRNEEGLGGAATYFSIAASNYTLVHLVGVVGQDFPRKHIELLESKKVDTAGLEVAPGKTFRWTGRYHEDINHRDTLDTQLNVFQEFHPKLPPAARDAEFLFLGNIHPALQLEVLDQSKARFVALDTMNFWIDTTPDSLRDVLARVHALIINDSEVKGLTGASNLVEGAGLVQKLGPRIVVVKKGEHGCLLFCDDRAFAAPAFPLSVVIDPTGAGDTFAGGFMGHIARKGSAQEGTLREAVIHGSVVASFTCEAFGPARLAEIGVREINERYSVFRDLTSF